MCGIVGYVGFNEASPILLDGLSKLEYRGYDSSGIAVNNGNKILVQKANGRIKVLKDMIGELKNFKGKIGIGHTRWATHGKPCYLNAHPHVSGSGKFAVVHNGIIENYLELKEMLIKSGIKFVSETDTEVIAQLLDYLDDNDFFSTVLKVLERIEGSYSLAIMSEGNKDELIAVKKNNPLIIGMGDKQNFIASDVNAVVPYTKRILRLNDGEIAVVRKDSVKVFDQNENLVQKPVIEINWDVSAAEKSSYEHFMMKEIFEQPKAVHDTISPRIKNGKIILDEINLSDDEIKNISKIVIVACGSAYHVGCVSKYVIENTIRKPVSVELASEFRYSNPLVDDSVLLIAISQSGETADTLAALREGKRLGAKTLSIVNVVGSSIATASDSVIYTLAGPEIAVATTKAYSTQLAVVYLLALYLGEKLGSITQKEYDKYVNELSDLPDKIKETLLCENKVKEIASKFFNVDDVFFIGRNLDFAVSLEGSLKLKEISYIHSEAYAAGELKHGTISLIEDGTLVVALSTVSELTEKMISNIKEVKARGATVFGICLKENKEICKVSDFEVCVPKVCNMMLPSVSVIPLQLFSYYVAYMKGCDIDKPRNLAKSVTVE